MAAKCVKSMAGQHAHQVGTLSTVGVQRFLQLAKRSKTRVDSKSTFVTLL